MLLHLLMKFIRLSTSHIMFNFQLVRKTALEVMKIGRLQRLVLRMHLMTLDLTMLSMKVMGRSMVQKLTSISLMQLEELGSAEQFNLISNFHKDLTLIMWEKMEKSTDQS